MGSEHILAIIPARGGSKGIPRKNLRLLVGKPLIAHTIEHALNSESVNRVIVSTDDAEIGQVSNQIGLSFRYDAVQPDLGIIQTQPSEQNEHESGAHVEQDITDEHDRDEHEFLKTHKLIDR